MLIIISSIFLSEIDFDIFTCLFISDLIYLTFVNWINLRRILLLFKTRFLKKLSVFLLRFLDIIICQIKQYTSLSKNKNLRVKILKHSISQDV